MTRIEPEPAAKEMACSTAVPAVLSLATRREAIGACRAALDGLRSVLVACTDRDLVTLAGDLAELRTLAGAGVVVVTAEAEQRGAIAASQCASTTAWVADSAWHSRREAGTIAKAAALLREPVYEPVADAVCDGDLDLVSAVACGQEFAKLAPDLSESAKPLVLEHLLDMACDHGPAGVRRLKDEILARYGETGEFEEQCERRRRHIELSAGRQTEGGMWDYRLTVDGEGRAVLEAVIGPGSAPKPAGISGCGDVPSGTSGIAPADAHGGGPQTAPRDTRPVGRRRGEALIDALRRSVAASRHVPTSPKAVLMLTMDYADLAATIGAASAGSSHASTGSFRFAARTGAGAGTGLATPAPTGPARPAAGGSGAGVVVGSRAAGELISRETVRKVACDAGIIPVVVGGRGEILDQGSLERCFTTGQVRALWRRDRHCTFPGCDVPAAWCDAHHLVHWIDGGLTDLDNGALLCSRHHSIVHRDQLAGQVTPKRGDPPGETSRGRLECAPNHQRRRRTGAPPERPPASVIWDLRAGTYPAAAGFLVERLSA